jgi:hypothetical protein
MLALCSAACKALRFAPTALTRPSGLDTASAQVLDWPLRDGRQFGVVIDRRDSNLNNVVQRAMRRMTFVLVRTVLFGFCSSLLPSASVRFGALPQGVSLRRTHCLRPNRVARSKAGTEVWPIQQIRAANTRSSICARCCTLQMTTYCLRDRETQNEHRRPGRDRTAGEVMNVQLSDRTLVCAECGVIDVVEDGERRFFEEQGYALPRRCRECRRLRQEHASRRELRRHSLSIGGLRMGMTNDAPADSPKRSVKGLVAILDALGAAVSSKDEAAQFLKSRDLVITDPPEKAERSLKRSTQRE